MAGVLLQHCRLRHATFVVGCHLVALAGFQIRHRNRSDDRVWNSNRLAEASLENVATLAAPTYQHTIKLRHRTADQFSADHSFSLQSHPSSHIPGLKNIVVGDEERFSNWIRAGQDSHKSAADATGACEDAS